MSDLQSRSRSFHRLWFTIYTTEREQSQQYTQRSGWAESAQTRVWIQLENLQHCCGELVSTSYRHSLFYFSAHFFLFSRVLKRKSHAQPHRQHMPNRRDSAFLGFSRSLHNLIGPAKYFFFLAWWFYFSSPFRSLCTRVQVSSTKIERENYLNLNTLFIYTEISSWSPSTRRPKQSQKVLRENQWVHMRSSGRLENFRYESLIKSWSTTDRLEHTEYEIDI